MRKDITKNDPEWEIFRDIYKFYEEYGTVEVNDDYWATVVDAANRFAVEHPHPLATHMIMAVLETFNDEVIHEQRNV